MFSIAILTGIYAYILIFLGLFGILYKNLIILTTIGYILPIIFWKTKKINLQKFHKEISVLSLKKTIKKIKQNKIITICLFLLGVQILINFLGALTPELAFDALWYHLTLPKIYIEHHQIVHIPGGLFYYSDMPKLIELLYSATLAFSNEILAKIIHFIFSILILIAVYKISRKKLSKQNALLAVVILSSNIVFAWEATTAYIDLGRTFFEIMALWAFIDWTEKKQRKKIILSAVMLGFAITTKILAITSLIIFITLIVILSLQNKSNPKNIVKDIIIFLGISLIIPTPWFIFAFIHTGNPVYPFFTQIYQVHPSISSNPILILRDIWQMFLYSSDPISPIYLISVPVLIPIANKFDKQTKIILTYSLLAILIWVITPRTGGGRFILPYLPAFSIIIANGLKLWEKQKYYQYVIITTIIIIALVTIGYRAKATQKYLPLLLGRQTKSQFLSQYLNFEFGDFYDTDNYFKTHIKPNDKVLLYGFHNLYYIDFPFVDVSLIKKGDKFNYIAIQNAMLPPRFKNWKEIYENQKTHIKLYTNKQKVWTY